MEGYRRLVHAHGVGHAVIEADIVDAGILRGISEQEFVRAVVGARITGCRRHGKWLIIESSGPAIVVHFGMTGSLHWSGDDESAPAQRWERVALSFTHGTLHYCDKRRLGGIWVTSADDVQSVTRPLGPDVAGISTATLTTQLRSRRGSIKAGLLAQDVVAGLGNTLSDEVLWRARIHPARKIAAMTAADYRRLRNAIAAAVTASFVHGRIPRTQRWLAGARLLPSPCPRCSGPLRLTTIAGRTSAWCPHCQPE